MQTSTFVRHRFLPLADRAFWRDFLRTATEDEILGLAAQLSFYLTFALFPALLGLIEILGKLELRRVSDVILSFLGGILPTEVVPLVVESVREAAAARIGGLAWAALLGSVIPILRAVSAIGRMLNRTARIPEDRGWIKKTAEQLLAIALMALVLLGVAAVIASFRPLVQRADSSILWVAWTAARWALWLVMFAFAVSFLYAFAPATRIQWRWLAPGPLAAAALWSSGSLFLRFAAAELLHYDALYGSVGSMILLLTWIYWTSIVVLVGGHLEASAQGAL